MKIKLFVLMFCIILLVGSVSALDLGFNQKKFIEGNEYGDIEIKDWWGFGSKLAEYTLEENTNECLIDCYAGGMVTLYKKEKLFTDLKFKGRDNKLRNLNHNIILIEVEETYLEEVEDYSYNNITSENGTITQESILVGSHNENKIRLIWKEYDNKVLDEGVYRWRIEGKKQLGEDIDWIVSAFGKDFTEWEWWNTDWNRKRQINITETSGSNLSDYSILINVTHDSNMLSNFSDLRFLNSTETGELDYWIQNKSDGNWATIWIEVTNLTASINTSIYMYYGNSGASSDSDIANAFIVGDDFESGSLNTSKWIKAGVTTAGWTVQSGSVIDGSYSLKGDGNGGLGYMLFISNLSIGISEFEVQALAKRIGGTGVGPRAVWSMSSGASGYFGEYSDGASSGVRISKITSGGSRTDVAGFGGGINYGTTVTKLRGWRLTNDHFVNATSSAGSSQVTGSSSEFSNLKWGVGMADFDASRESIFDNIFIRNKASSEPTSLIGEEEILFLINLNSPIDNFNTTNPIINFNGTIIAAFGVTNVSLFLDGILNETNSSGVNDTNYLFTKVIADGNHNWTYEACDGDECITATTRNFSIDTTLPIINITFPIGVIDFHEINTNLSLNWTVSDANLDSCWFDWNGTNNTVICLDNQTNINITDGTNKNLTFYANDTFGNINSSTISWDYKIFQNSLTFVSPTIGGNTESFILNITKQSSLQISLVDLVYNSSSSSALFTLGDTSIISKDFQVPNPSSDTNFSFHFSFTMSDASIINTSSNNQTVLNFAIGNCTTFTTLVYNFTMLDEENETQFTNVTIEYAFNLTDRDRTTLISNFSFESTVNPTSICINQNLTSDSVFSLDGVLKYKALEGDFLTRYYNILNFSLTNLTIPNNINIYSVLSSVATPFKLTFRDSSLTLTPNILVNVNKQFVSSDDFKTVEIPITDTNGQTVLNLVRNIAIYNLIFTDVSGTIIASFNKVAAFCQDFTIGDCVLNLDAPSSVEGIGNISEILGVSQSLIYDNTTSVATLTFSSIDSQPRTMRLVGTTQNQFGNSSVCDNSLTSTLGTVTCNASSILATDNYLFIDSFSDGRYIETNVININPETPLIGGIYGSNGYFIAFLMILTIIILFSDDKQILLIMLGVGWAVILILGLLKGTIIGKTSAGIWLLVTIITFLWKLKKEEVGF